MGLEDKGLQGEWSMAVIGVDGIKDARSCWIVVYLSNSLNFVAIHEL
jgi:hypothetical protein